MGRTQKKPQRPELITEIKKGIIKICGVTGQCNKNLSGCLM